MTAVCQAITLSEGEVISALSPTALNTSTEHNGKFNAEEQSNRGSKKNGNGAPEVHGMAHM